MKGREKQGRKLIRRRRKAPGAQSREGLIILDVVDHKERNKGEVFMPGLSNRVERDRGKEAMEGGKIKGRTEIHNSWGRSWTGP